MFRSRRTPSLYRHHHDPDRTVEQAVERARRIANPSGVRIGL